MTVHDQMCTPAGVQEVAKEWWDCDIIYEMAERFSVKYVEDTKDRVKQDRANGWFITAAGPLVWLKSHLNDLGLLPISGERVHDDSPTPVTAVLHIGFLSVPETDEMLSRLHTAPRQHDCNNPARSKMFETAQRQDVTAIDRTAAIVSKPKGD
jgi:hypothetical protein